MSWKEKYQPTPFDALPIEGLTFVETSYIGADGQKAEYKSPYICFTSGLTYPLSASRNPNDWALIELASGLHLPYRDTRDNALETANRAAKQQGYLVAVNEENGLIIIGHRTEDCLIVTYDNNKSQMENVELLLP